MTWHELVAALDAYVEALTADHEATAADLDNAADLLVDRAHTLAATRYRRFPTRGET